jgi:short-subunit dehydrogenase
MDAPTAVLIGVTGGLGHALAKLLAAEGFRMVLAARRGASTMPRR